MFTDNKNTLGYADLITELNRAPKRNRLVSNILNLGAGIANYAILNGLGEISEGLSGTLEVIIPIAHILFFLLLIGRGSIDRGFFLFVNFFGSLGNYIKIGIDRIGNNFLPFAVNVAIMVFIYPWMVWGLAIASHFFLVTNFLESIHVLNPLGGGDAVFGFFMHNSIIPYIISGVASVMNWAFFKQED